MRARIAPLVAVAVGAALGLTLSLTPSADASRNSSGTYALPTGNPVVPGTTISSTWANSTLGDISSELTDSLSRSGKGAMQAPLKLATGTVAAPALSWDADPDTGLYRPSAGTVAMSADATQVQTWTAAGTNFKRPANFDVGLVADGGVTASSLTVSGATQLATLNVSGTATVAGQGMFTGGAAAVTLKPGTLNHTYMEFYSNSALPAVRSGYFGYPGAFSNSMVLANEAAPNGQITLVPSSGEVVLSGTKFSITGATPASGTGFYNAVTPKNIVKAWATITTTGGGSTATTVLDGFNVFSASVSTTQLTVNMTANMANNNYAILVTPFASTISCGAVFNGANSFSVSCRDISGSTLPFPFYNFQTSGSIRMHIAVLGAQPNP
ncbi:hypothetical protein [Corallococcus silvisoli]|uniref:hypothetical protein n=1 Tax=Corallococcus silvisoli TaxID=2697031 RepID=UPI001377E7A0|nr:hypothetical protein [Corallococcus silvisoli]NBD11843.1 hypothetical protein [Corallococcus silvisoli]